MRQIIRALYDLLRGIIAMLFHVGVVASLGAILGAIYSSITYDRISDTSYLFGAFFFATSCYSVSWVIAQRRASEKESEIAFWTSVGITFVLSVSVLFAFRTYFSDQSSLIHGSIFLLPIINGLLMGAISDAIAKDANRSEIIRGSNPGIYSDLKNLSGGGEDSITDAEPKRPGGRFNNSGGMHIALSMVLFPAFYIAMIYLYSFVAKPFASPYADECLNAITVIAGTALFVCVYFLSRLFFRKICHSLERLSVMRTDYFVIGANLVLMLFFVVYLRMPQRIKYHAFQFDFPFLLVSYVVPVAFSAGVYTKSLRFLKRKESTQRSVSPPPSQEISPQPEAPAISPSPRPAPESLPSIFSDESE